MKILCGVFVIAFYFVVPCTPVKQWESEVANISCPCSNPKWCQPITTKIEKEVFAFSIRNEESHWNLFDWSKLTTVVMFGYFNQSLICLAHSHGVRVVILGGISKSTLLNPSLRKQWINKFVTTIENNFLDGINFDYEGEVLKNETQVRDAYTQTVNETYTRLKTINSNYQISVDVAWRPNIDSRYYDYHGLAKVSDFLFVMAYDEQSQIFGECVAGPNSGFDRALQGLDAYMTEPSLNINPNKLILGVPWYGYIYPCIRLDKEKCYIKKVPFRGVNCSDAAGRQYDIGYIEKLLMTMPDSYRWNTSSSTPYITYTDPLTGKSYQVHYDNPQSLILKYKLAKEKNLRGIGMWNIDSLDYTDTVYGEQLRHRMFTALHAFIT